jgi:hypothetical protein
MKRQLESDDSDESNELRPLSVEILSYRPRVLPSQPSALFGVGKDMINTKENQ